MLAFLLLTNDYATITLLRKIQANIHTVYTGLMLAFYYHFLVTLVHQIRKSGVLVLKFLPKYPKKLNKI